MQVRSKALRALPWVAILGFLLCCFVVTSTSLLARPAQRLPLPSTPARLIPPTVASQTWARLANPGAAAPLPAAALQYEDPIVVPPGSLLAFFQRWADSSWSTGLHGSRYAYDLIESVHVWALCLFFGLAVLFDFRLLGWSLREVPVSEVAHRLLPWTVVGFAVMVASGALLFSAIPLRSYQNIFFRTKMILLVVAGLNVLIFHSGVFRRVSSWDLAARPPRPARVAGALSIILWVCIVLSGRMIAYNWFDCDRQPQPAIINYLTSCIPPESGH